MPEPFASSQSTRGPPRIALAAQPHLPSPPQGKRRPAGSAQRCSRRGSYTIPQTPAAGLFQNQRADTRLNPKAATTANRTEGLTLTFMNYCPRHYAFPYGSLTPHRPTLRTYSRDVQHSGRRARSWRCVCIRGGHIAPLNTKPGLSDRRAHSVCGDTASLCA